MASCSLNKLRAKWMDIQVAQQADIRQRYLGDAQGTRDELMCMREEELRRAGEAARQGSYDEGQDQPSLCAKELNVMVG
jgi:hypothetical protein